MRKTKIVCTLGPATGSEQGIKELISAGMNVARINCSHGDWETRKQWIAWVRKHSPALAPIAILVDLQGPKFRIGPIAKDMMELRPGQTLSVGPEKDCDLPILDKSILRAMGTGDRLLLGDGNVELKILSGEGSSFKAKAISGGLVKSRQGVTVVGKIFETPTLTPKDKSDISEACKLDIDYIALSYVKHGSDMRKLRQTVEKLDAKVKLCAKIETREAINELDSIIRASDLVMVARGDMGLQMDIEEVPLAQKEIIRKCQDMGVPVITATQMLESMISAPRPTRAETTDIANAILDGTDAVMLSAETASGSYPVEAVRYMSRIAERAESVFDYSRVLSAYCHDPEVHDRTEAVAFGVAQIASLIRPKAILTTTTSGQTARLVSKFRPRVPILCVTWDERVYHQLSVIWGVEAILMPTPKTTDEQMRNAVRGFKAAKRLKAGDLVVISAGVPAGTPGMTNLIMTEVVK